MDKEQSYFFSIIKDYIWNLKTKSDESVDWQRILDYSQSHQLMAIVYHQCKDFMPPCFAKKIQETYLGIISSNVKRRKITDNILTSLQENGIVYFLVKGFAIADFYPNWQYRTMGDVDIVVDNREKAHIILEEYGFHNESKILNNSWHYTMNSMEFELHDRLAYEEVINDKRVTDFLYGYKDYVSDYRLEDSFHFIYVLYHLQKHLLQRGIGVRQFLDIAILIKNNSNLKWTWIEEQLSQIGMLPFAKIVLFFIEKWFNVSAPILSTAVSNDVFINSTEYVLSNGVFGFDNDDNIRHLASNTVRKSRFPKLTMIKLALYKIFPSYKSMIKADHYAFLRGKPILLPVAWLYRFVLVIRDNKIGEGKKQISKSFVSKEYIEKREVMFRNWGLK